VPAIHIKIHHTKLPNPLGQFGFITGINFTALFRVCYSNKHSNVPSVSGPSVAVGPGTMYLLDLLS